MNRLFYLILFSLTSGLAMCGPTGLIASAFPGALKVRSQAWGQQLHYNPLPVNIEGFEQGKLNLHLQRTHASLWGYERKYILDAQTVDEIVQVELGLNPHLKFQFGFSQRRLQSSGMDQITTGFHKLFFIPQDKRLEVDLNRNLITLPTYGLELNEDDEGLPYSQTYDWAVDTKFEWPQLYASLVGSIGMSQEQAGASPREHRAIDWSMQVYWQAFLPSQTNLQYFLGVHWVRMDQADRFDKSLQAEQSILTSGMGWNFLKNTDAKLQLVIAEPIYQDLGQLSRETYEIQAGIQHRWSAMNIQFVLIENVIWPYNTPDWGWSLAVDYGLPSIF